VSALIRSGAGLRVFGIDPVAYDATSNPPGTVA
jgi:hypothetical protein